MEERVNTGERVAMFMLKTSLCLAAIAATGFSQECPRPAALQRALKPSVNTQAVRQRLASQRPGRSVEPTRGTIDRHLFEVMEQAGVSSARICTDEEYLRRATLDLTGRIPTRTRVEAFLNDRKPYKRERLVDELLASPDWTDKWTMFFGDLFKNSVNPGRQRAFREREALNGWVKAALKTGKPYDEMARELITARGESSFEDGRLGFLSWAGLAIQLDQDRIDLQTVQVADVFLGLSHMDCLLCHNGRGHLDDISLWGRQTTRRRAWEFSAFFGKTTMGLANGQVDGIPRQAPWFLRDDPAKAGYTLGTTAGDRPARGGSGVVKPFYLNDETPAEGEDYRVFLARQVTADPQFARAAVNYIWREFFVLGIVEPANQFDLARLDPDNPPPAPWTLQPTNARLLRDLAGDFARAKFDLKSLMRQMATSQAYQLSSGYDGEWKPEYEPLFARKYVRRLWAEEIHDAIAQASGVPSTYTAMQLQGGPSAPGPGGTPGGFATADPVAEFIDAFLRGNRVDQPRSGDFTLEQALRLMNNPFVLDRIQVSAERMRLSDAELVDELFLSVLGHLPSDAERGSALALLTAGDRAGQASHLLWSLFNKADFIYNY